MKLQGGGPVLYRQQRLGEHGEQFEMLKLRSMRPDAEADGARWSEADDDRVTPVGRILRRTHIDELPQLWNVLRGDMTLVGPRPERPRWSPSSSASTRTTRGATWSGPASPAGPSCAAGTPDPDLGTAWKLCHDLYYIKHRSVARAIC